MSFVKLMALVVLGTVTVIGAAEVDVNGKFKRDAKGKLIGWSVRGGGAAAVKGSSALELKLSPKDTWGGIYGKSITLKLDEKAVMTVNASGVGKIVFGASWYNAKGQWYRNDQIGGKLTDKAQDFRYEIVRGKPGMPDAVSFTPTVLIVGKDVAKINFIKVDVVKK